MGLVDLRQVVGELQRVAEALGHQPVDGAELPQVAHEDQRQPPVAGDLRDALNAVLLGDVARVVAERLQAIDVLAAEAEAGLVDERSGEHLRVAERQAVGAAGLVSLRVGPAVGRSLEGAGLVARRPPEAVAREDVVVRGEVVVDAHVEGVDGLAVEPVRGEVVDEPRLVRGREQVHQLDGVGIEPVGRDDVSREGVAHEAVAGGHAPRDRIDLAGEHLAGGGRVEDRAERNRAPEQIGAAGAGLAGDEVREVGVPAVALALGGHGDLPDLVLLGQAAFIVDEEERLVPHHWAAGGEAELVRVVPPLLEPPRVLEELRRLEPVVAVELPGAAVERVRARLQGRAQHGAAGPPVLRPEGARQHLDLGDGVDGGLDHVGGAAEEVHVARVVVDAVEHVVVLPGPGAVGRELQGSARALLGAGGARAQARERGVVAAVQGQVLDDARGERLAHLARLRLEQRHLGHDLHRFLELSGLEADVHHRLLLEGQLDAAADRLPEAGRLHLDPVRAETDRSEDVGAVIPGHA